ncbi:hypothetical protein GCM10025867_12120 [Frondihabitans sucicola]|uniref:Lipoprotein LpqN n=1 Tax=Frondihabitans sucicola TaxID=1268041 RepID=A0ABM8GKP7_9MICO|nr:LpqN/LpqT family lipoprotein [Frondihabitans sucicola]BDZ48971.1 hypothetical protein GCM10025867_12120 [Frondihabitans sucicola]
MNDLHTRVFVEAPEPWEVVPLDGAELAVAAPETPGAYRPNVVVTITPTRGLLPFERVVVSAGHRLQELPEYVEIGHEAITLLGGPGYRFEGSYRHPELGTLFQALSVTVVPRGAVTEVVEITGSCSASEALTQVPVIRDIVASARTDLPGDTDAQ